ncbi:MAG: hypothetical protein ABJA93_04285 [Sporichthyaceae bacterium]
MRNIYRLVGAAFTYGSAVSRSWAYRVPRHGASRRESTMDQARNLPRTMITALLAALALALLALAIAAALPGLASDLAGNGWHKSGTAPVAGNGWHSGPATLAGNGWH